jgi:SOS-response transcriptional repressor LexA
MPSSCSRGEFPVDSLELSPERGSHSSRLTLPQRNSAYIRGIETHLAGHTAENAGLSGDPQKVLIGRVIFGGHNSAGQKMAQLLPEKYNCGNNPEPRGKEGLGVSPLPEWAIHIGNLLKRKRLTQQTFAAKMNVTQSSVSNWIAGKKEPKSEMYYRMAKVWPDADEAQFFLKRASALSGSFQVQYFGVQKAPSPDRRMRPGKLSDETVEIALLKDPAVLGTSRQADEKEFERILPFPSSLCPHPETTVCIKVIGDSMSPIMEDGYIVAIDFSQTDRQRLNGQMVAARDPQGEVTVKLFKQHGKDEVLLPHHISRKNQPTVLNRDASPESRWEIVGKVLWWIGLP